MEFGKILSDIRIPKAFREVITLIGGSGFLIVLWVLKLRHLDFDLGITLVRPELDFLILVIAYLTGKTCLYLAHSLDFLMNVINYFINSPDTSLGNCCKKIKDFFTYQNVLFKPFFITEIKDTMTTGEISKALQEHVLFEENFEREHQHLLFVKFLLLYSILGVLYLNSATGKITGGAFLIIFLLEFYRQKRRIFISWVEFQKYILKYKNKGAAK